MLHWRRANLLSLTIHQLHCKMFSEYSNLKGFYFHFLSIHMRCLICSRVRRTPIRAFLRSQSTPRQPPAPWCSPPTFHTGRWCTYSRPQRISKPRQLLWQRPQLQLLLVNRSANDSFFYLFSCFLLSSLPGGVWGYGVNKYKFITATT